MREGVTVASRPPAPTTERVSVVLIGAGITGLAAAIRLAATGTAVLVLQAANRVDGKLRAAELAGIDVGAEATLTRHPRGRAGPQDRTS